MTDRLRLRIHVFLLFCAMASLIPFIANYLEARGLDSSQVAGLLALMPVVSLLTQPLYGYLADRFHIHRLLLVLLPAITAAITPLLLLAGSFWQFVPILILYSLAFSTVIPLADSVIFGVLARHPGSSYGSIRFWGTFSYMIVCYGAGWLLHRFGYPALFGLHAAFLLASGVSALLLPPVARPQQRLEWSHASAILRNRNLIAFFACAFVVQGFFTSGSLYLGPLLKGLGVGEDLVGLTWALSVLLELPMMALSGRLLHRFGLKPLLLAGMLFAGARWGISAFTTHLPVVIAAQMLHGVTFALLHVGAVHFIDRFSPPHARALGQTLYAGYVMSGGRIVGFLVYGWAAKALGWQQAFGVSAALTLLAALCFWQFVREPEGGERA